MTRVKRSLPLPLGRRRVRVDSFPPLADAKKARWQPTRRKAPDKAEGYRLIVNGTENSVVSQAILISPFVWWFSKVIVS